MHLSALWKGSAGFGLRAVGAGLCMKRWIMCLHGWCSKSSHSWGTLFPGCQTFDVKMLIKASSPSCLLPQPCFSNFTSCATSEYICLSRKLHYEWHQVIFLKVLHCQLHLEQTCSKYSPNVLLHSRSEVRIFCWNFQLSNSRCSRCMTQILLCSFQVYIQEWTLRSAHTNIWEKNNTWHLF